MADYPGFGCGVYGTDRISDYPMCTPYTFHVVYHLFFDTETTRLAHS